MKACRPKLIQRGFKTPFMEQRGDSVSIMGKEIGGIVQITDLLDLNVFTETGSLLPF